MMRLANHYIQAGLLTSGVASYVYYQTSQSPLHVVWDLDHTLLCSVTPLEKGKAAAAAASRPPSSYFDQIDDDFDFREGTPNTRTFLRPGAHAALRFVGTFATQHIYTAAQATYTNNILEHLDPKGEIFATVTHRDIVPHQEWDPLAKEGKDLRMIPGVNESILPVRMILFDDRLYNFTPQPANGIHVRSYDDVGSRDWELARLCFIAGLALLAPDVRPLLKIFWSDDQKSKFKEMPE